MQRALASRREWRCSGAIAEVATNLVRKVDVPWRRCPRPSGSPWLDRLARSCSL